MNYVNKVLMPNERIVFIGTLHWIIFLPGVCFTVLGAGVGYFSHDLVDLLTQTQFSGILTRVIAGGAFISTLIGLWLLIGALVRQSATELAITNRRLIAKYGFVSRATFEIMINRVTGVNFDQTITGRLFGFGTVLVHGAGGDLSPFDGVANPQLFQRALMDVLENGK